MSTAILKVVQALLSGDRRYFQAKVHAFFIGNRLKGTYVQMEAQT